MERWKPRTGAGGHATGVLRVAAFTFFVTACVGRSEARHDESQVPAQQAVELAPGLVSNGHRFMVALTPDGSTLYTVERRFPSPGAPPDLVIFEATRDARGEWSAPDTASFSGRWSDIDPAFAPGGQRLWFNSSRPAPDRDSARTDFDIWYLDREGEGWGTPQRLPEPVNTTGSEFFATSTRDGTLYFTVSRRAPVRRSFIVRSRPVAEGRWSAPDTVRIGTEPLADASNPFIAPDESWLVFVSERPGGFGDADLYLSERVGAGWSAPRNLGKGVNTALSEFAPSVSEDGSTLFFTRMRRGADRNAVEERLFSIPMAAVRGR